MHYALALVVLAFYLLVSPVSASAIPTHTKVCVWDCVPFDFRCNWFYPKYAIPCKCLIRPTLILANGSTARQRNVFEPGSVGGSIDYLHPTVTEVAEGIYNYAY